VVVVLVVVLEVWVVMAMAMAVAEALEAGPVPPRPMSSMTHLVVHTAGLQHLCTPNSTSPHNQGRSSKQYLQE
jgi:hypothetical protein